MWLHRHDLEPLLARREAFRELPRAGREVDDAGALVAREVEVGEEAGDGGGWVRLEVRFVSRMMYFWGKKRRREGV